MLHSPTVSTCVQGFGAVSSVRGNQRKDLCLCVAHVTAHDMGKIPIPDY